MDRIPSGSARLDAVLGGGIPANAITLVTGVPGSGKTILAYQYVFANATQQRPALYYSTLSEAHEKLLRYGQGLSYFDTSAVGSSVFFEALGPVVRSGGLDAVVQRVAEDIKTYRPGVIVIDSFRALADFADTQTYRTFLADLADLLSAFPVSTFWISEYMAAGLEVYPRLADEGDPSAYVARTTRTSSGVAAIDALVQEGFLAGSSTLIAGPSGSGKTLMGLHFIFAGIAAGEPGAIAVFQENPSQLEAIAAGFGWDLKDPLVDLLYSSTVDLYVDEWMYTLLDRIERIGARRVLIDSLGDLEAATTDPVRFREFVYSLIQRCTRAGISVTFTMELPELFRVHRLTQGTFSHLSDNVVLLQYVPDEGKLKRALTIIKSRATRHDPGIYEFDINGTGIVLGEGIMEAAGTPP